MKANKNNLLLILVFLVSIGLFFWFRSSPYYDNFFLWSSKNIIVFSVTLFVVKVAGIVYPPVPGGIFTLASVPFLGWPLAYLLDLAGSAVGASIAFYLGKNYGYRLLSKFFDDSTIEKIKKTKIKKNREFEAIFMYKIFGGTVLELLCYAAGVLGLNFWIFMIAHILTHALFGIPTFYFTKNILEGGNLWLGAVSLVFLIFLFSKLKNRYFE